MATILEIMSKLSELSAQVRTLSPHERRILAEVALDFQIEAERNPEIDAAWDREIRRRIQEIDDGLVEGLDADEVFAELREKHSL